jgi:hypothetical protein
MQLSLDTLDDEEEEEREEGEEEEKEEEEEKGTKNDENMQHKKRTSTLDSREWGTCPNCMGCGFVQNICSECNKDGMKCHIICGEALVSMVFGKVMMSSPKTSAENFLHAMVTASSELDVEHFIDSRLAHFKLCGMTTVFDVVAHCYRLHQANHFDCMYERTGEMTLVVVCNPAYELFCEVGAICFVHQHRMQPSHRRSYMIPSQQRMFQDNIRDLGAVTVEAKRNNRVSDNISIDKYLWHGDNGASCHEANDTAGIFDYSRIHSSLKIGNCKYFYSSRIGKRKVMVVQANGS